MRFLSTLLVLPLLFASAPSVTGQQEPQLSATSGARIEVHRGGEELLLSIEARQISAEALMRGIARKLNLELTGFELVGRDALIDAYLHEQPVKDAIRWKWDCRACHAGGLSK